MWESDEAERGAAIIYMGARPALDGQRVALFQVGERATTAILGDDRQPLLASTLPLGVQGLRDGWLQSDPSSASDHALIAEWVRTVTGPTIARFREAGFDAVALTSHTAIALGRLAGRPLGRAGAGESYQLSLRSLRSCQRILARMTADERANVPGLDPAQADSIVPGAIMLRSILESTKVESALVCHDSARRRQAEPLGQTGCESSTGWQVCRMKEGLREDPCSRRLLPPERTSPEARREHHSPLPHALSVSGVGV
jgi:exopolyphosphatase/pppGpp-phosphohydrolase